ncbi:MAG: uroporphyrinogen-III C-methyltransferase [Eggerthellaceae bacterium]|nr:uroporphyrinogen-III C-methyltransferase [Eggerthellaceae bacterium]
MSDTGKVWLVGAGPGDAGLFTRKGYDVLQAADVVVYDSLVGDGVLAMVPEGARCIDVGKRAANHTMPQEQIDQVLLDEALAGNRVVRLKGGDPFLFGRGGEELELLTKNNVPYEVVPGITSAIAVPAYNGIPVTHRDFTSSLHIITGHKRAGASYDIDFDALVRTKGTLVVLMGVRSLPDIVAGLTGAGMDAATPAAVLQEGTTAGQRRAVATLSTLEQAVQDAGIQAPAIIVVGDVCELAEQFAWYEKLPLAGCKVVVTRPKELVSTMSERLRTAGAEVLEIPSIATVPFDTNPALDEAIAALDTYSWIVLTSPSGADIFFDALGAAKADVRRLASCKVAALGSGTAKALAAHGIQADFVPSHATGETLGAELAKTAAPGSRILIPRAAIGGQELVEALADFTVDDVATYDTVALEGGLVDLSGQFESGRIFCAAFTSSSGVTAFAKAHPGLDMSLVQAACIGEKTRETANTLGMRTWMAAEPSIDSLLDLIVEQFTASKE